MKRERKEMKRKKKIREESKNGCKKEGRGNGRGE